MDELLRQAKRLVMTAENALKSKDEKKWHTRRVIVPQLEREDQIYGEAWNWKKPPERMWLRAATPGTIRRHFHKGRAKYEVGNLCWIAEPYQIKDETSFPSGKQQVIRGIYGDQSNFGVILTEQETAKFRRRKYPYRYSAGRFMYKSLARTIVEIKRVWTEQIQDIDIEDAVAEGYPLSWANAVADGLNAPQAIEWFHELWDSINKSRGFGWDTNPWVYAYEYELVKKLR